MATSLIQLALRCSIMGLVFVPIPTSCALMKLKRSPLEIGWVSFSAAANLSHRSIYPINKTITNSKRTNGAQATASVLVPAHSKHLWIPGHVHHHAFIPAHHVVIPTHSLILSQTVLVRPDLLYKNENNLFRSHVGGFGIGVDIGGHGAGHGHHATI